ncbi:MAG TPA: hypothetical protein VJU58_13770 [Microbacterium sp.]|nr:hypothetical protein [Microbacterium sp.]
MRALAREIAATVIVVLGGLALIATIAALRLIDTRPREVCL